MKVIRRNGDIPIDMLYPHPDNPRRDVGDVTELAESIKANGIFQNLTVIYGGKGVEEAHPGEDVDGYTVIIGHRRLAAAKLAGLTKVPCLLAEMDEKEQISTMLLENMQRSDLTVYEQAQGFQMMLDLGETKYEIAEKTGFSMTTIRHRLNLLKLDRDELRKAEERQVTIQDMIELERISDPALKNEALKQAGTNNFQNAVERAVADEKHREIVKEWKKLFGSLGEEIPYTDKTKKRQIMSYYISRSPAEQKERIEALAADNQPVYWCMDQYNYIYMLGEPNKNAPSVDQLNEKRRRAQEAKGRRIERIGEVESRAELLRDKFCKRYAGRTEDMPILLEAVFADPNRLYLEPDIEALAKFFSISTDVSEDDDREIEEIVFSNPKYRRHLKCEPARVMLAWLWADIDNHYIKVHDYNGEYRRNEYLERWYDVIEKLGYSMSDEERALLDGTHECFKDEEAGNVSV